MGMATVGFADGNTLEVLVPGPEALAQYKADILEMDSDQVSKDHPNWGDVMMLGVILALDATSEFAMALNKWIIEHGQHGPSCEGNQRLRNLKTGELDRGPCTCGLREMCPAADDRIDTGGTNA